jgi:hypothetical protein
MEVRLSIEGEDPVRGLEELSDWLRQESDLRGLIRSADTRLRPGELGALPDALIAAVGSGGVLSVLAASLKVYLAQPRRSDIRIKVATPDGLTVELEAQRVDDVEPLLRRMIEASER